MTHQLPELNYAFDALEPHVDARTMEIHHDKHHAGYVSKLNAALEKLPNLAETAVNDVNDLIMALSSIPEPARTAVRHNGGGHANHSLFWRIMSPNGGGKPSGPLAVAIEGELGGFDTFRKAFSETAAGQFGSGWAWLGVQADGTLCVCSTPNQDSPLMPGITDFPCRPILCLDVWEHAYYLSYQNKRADYIEAWWNVVDWPTVANLYEEAKSTLA